MSKTLRKAALAQGYWLERATPTEELRRLIAALRPIHSDHELIRCGSNGDGGYLIPNDLVGVTACFSPGVKDSVAFELDMAKRGIPSFMIDYSIEKLPQTHPMFDFERRFVGAHDIDPFISLDSWVARKQPDGSDLVLQMDVEGYEYETFFTASPVMLEKFRIMVVEFHGLDRLFNPGFFQIARLTFDKLLSRFDVVHLHPNNCRQPVGRGDIQIPPVMEFTFLRKDRVSTRQPTSQFPHPLDAANKAKVADLVLPAIWRGRT
ncbi:MAG: hypothetical protein EXQ88_07035 [Alphaproteobacteria bacterium]|nr:hypothetical protein [Alphaproteobacteria bacterium]